MININDQKYWNDRFASGDWADSGRAQTQEYAKANIEVIEVDKLFSGTLLDFGCALGDAIPIFSKELPHAQLYGMDISQAAVDKCIARYGDIARFYCGAHEDVKFHDVIIASHVMEHLDDDKSIVECLLGKCRDLFIIVPYKETPLFFEHVNFYDETYYDELQPKSVRVFNVSYRRKLSFLQYIKGLLKLRLRKDLYFSKDMVVFHFAAVK